MGWWEFESICVVVDSFSWQLILLLLILLLLILILLLWVDDGACDDDDNDEGCWGGCGGDGDFFERFSNVLTKNIYKEKNIYEEKIKENKLGFMNNW